MTRPRERRVTVENADLEKHDQPIGLRFKQSDMSRLKEEADKRGVGPSTLARVIVEKWLRTPDADS